MNLRPQRADIPEVNLTPLIDVVFLLLIFFMVSTTFKRDAELTVELPEASTPPSAEQKQALEVVIDAEGRYFIDDKELVKTDVSAVMNELMQATRDHKDRPLIIRADARAPHQAVVTVMDAAGQAGILHMSIATTQPASP